MSLVKKKLARVELWDDIEADGGARLRFFAGVLTARDIYEIGGREELRVTVARDQAYWDDLDHDRVVRTVDEDGNFDEWRIRKINDGKGAAGKENVTLECDSIRFDLVNNAQIMERAEFDGSCNTHFEYYNLTPQQHTEVILEWAPDYFDIHPSFPDLDTVDMIFHDDTPLSALMELALIVGYELEVTRNGATSYYVNLVAEIGSATEKIEIRNGGNLITGLRKQDSTDMGTRVYVRGGQQFGREGTLAGASFAVVLPTNPESTFAIDFTLADDFGVIEEDGQLNGLYVVGHDGSHSQIVSSIAPSTIRTASQIKLPPDGRMRLQRSYIDLVTGDTLYCDLTYLELPSAINDYGIKSALLERSDIPAINNILPNPFLTEWEDGGLPTAFRNMETPGSPTKVQNTHPLYTRHGGSSLYVKCAPGVGIRTAEFIVIPTEANPFLVVQAQLFVVTGHVRMEMRCKNLDPEIYETVFPPPGIIATTITQGGWVDSFGVNPGGSPEDNWYTRMTETGLEYLLFEIALMGGDDPTDPDTPDTEFYLDALQVTQTPSFAEVFFGGRASNELWKLGNIALRGLSVPAQEYRIQIIDLWRLDPDNYTVNEIVAGGPIRIVDEEISLDFTTRIIKVTRNLLVEGETQIEVENITNDLSRIMGAAERRIRRELMTREGYDPTTGLLTGPDDEFSDDPADDDNIAANDNYEQCVAASTEHCSADSAGEYTFWVYDENRIELVADSIAIGSSLAWGFQGKIDRTAGEITGDPPPPGGETNPEGNIRRVSSGLVFGMDDQGAGNIQRWDFFGKWANVAGTWAVRDSKKLVCTSATGGTVRCTGFTPIGDMVVHVRFEIEDCWQDVDCAQHAPKGSGLMPICRMEVSGSNITYGYAMQHTYKCSPAGPCFNQGTFVTRTNTKFNGGARSNIAGPTDSGIHSGYMKYIALDGDQRFAIGGGFNPNLAASDNSLAGRTGTVGFQFTETTDAAIIAVYVCESNEITCSGLPTGYYFGTVFGNAGLESGGVAVSSMTSLHFPWTNLRIWSGPPSLATEVANFSPEGGIFGGDVFEFGGPEEEDPPVFIDETTFAAVIDLIFYDVDDTEILSTAHAGVATLDYTRGTGTVVVPEGAAYIIPVAKRIGEGEGVACVKELVVNTGTVSAPFKSCDLVFGGAINVKVPSDEGLLVYLPFDDFKYPKGDHADGVTNWNACVADPDGTIALSRTEFDASVNRNHFKLVTWKHQPDTWSPEEYSYRWRFRNGWMPEIGVSGWGRVIPPWSVSGG
jgi:hypothetical protein